LVDRSGGEVRKYIVTGSEGFIAGHVIRLLQSRGDEVMGVDRKRGAPACLDLFDLNPGDLPPVDAIIHCAAKADISRNWDRMIERTELYHDNIIALVALLEAAITKRFVFVSTAAVAAGSLSPYVASKVSGEALVQAYAHRYGWEWEAVRLVSCVGSGYHHGHVADFVRMASKDGVVKARTSGAIKNPFVHVEDAAAALVAASDKPRMSAGYVAAEPWSWLDTVRVMRDEGMTFDDIPGEREAGWIGDPHLGGIYSDYPTPRKVADGVRDAVRGLR
jgi:nucleoside-diphosphate-sugar epimerase